MRLSPYTSGYSGIAYAKGRDASVSTSVRLGDKKRGFSPLFHHQKSSESRVCQRLHHTQIWEHKGPYQALRKTIKDIPPARRLFQRDLFRVSTERTVLADLDFTEFRHFQNGYTECRFRESEFDETRSPVLRLYFRSSHVNERTERLNFGYPFFSAPSLHRR